MANSRAPRSRLPHWIAAPLLCAICADPALAQSGRFLTVGGGASFPTGDASAAMDPGWMTEVMGGVVLPGNFASLRVGGMYGQSRVTGGTGMQAMEGGTQRIVGAMGGLMVMPDWNRDWVPYALATAGAINARFQGNATSFAWSTGAGATLQWEAVDFYVEGRFLQARKSAARGEMVSVTTGIRLSR